MKKLIERQQDLLVTCDNPNCDYTVPYTKENQNDLIWYIGKPCPKCGENLLTVEDYCQYQKMIKAVNFINRWFSWITIFFSKKRIAKSSFVCVEVHDGVKISKH